MDKKTYRRARIILKVGKIWHLVWALPFIFCLSAAIGLWNLDAALCTLVVGLIHGLMIVLEVLAHRTLYKGKRIYRNSILEMNRRRYIGFPYCEIKDYKKELQLVRENYNKDTRYNKNQIPYVDTPDFKMLYEYATLHTGNIYYGYLVMANSALFDTNSKFMLAPGVFLYSTDPYYEENPLELGTIARKLYINRENNFLKDENSYEKNVRIDMELTEGREVYASSILMYRAQFPMGYLSGRVLPIIANPTANTSTFVVDVMYWSANLIANFAKADDLCERVQYELKHSKYNKALTVANYQEELAMMQEKYCKLLKEVEGDELFNDCASFKVLYSYVVDLKKSFNNPFSKIYDFPAVALYSEDEYYKEHPEELKVIADKLLASVNGRQIIKGIIDYRRHTYTKFILPREWTDGREIHLTSIFIQKLGLPFYYVNSRILPIIKTPEEEANLVALSKDFWSEAFIAEFINCQDDFAKEVREKYHLR